VKAGLSSLAAKKASFGNLAIAAANRLAGNSLGQVNFGSDRGGLVRVEPAPI
jgi:hypothetical protein